MSVPPERQSARRRDGKAALFEGAPPFVGVVAVGKQTGADAAPHLRVRHLGPLEQHQLRLAPALQVVAAHQPAARRLLAAGGTERGAVVLHGHDPLPAEAHDVARIGQVEVVVQRGEGTRLAPVDQVGALDRSELERHPPLLRRIHQPRQPVEHAKHPVVVVNRRIPMRHLRRPPHNDGARNPLPGDPRTRHVRSPRQRSSLIRSGC